MSTDPDLSLDPLSPQSGMVCREDWMAALNRARRAEELATRRLHALVDITAEAAAVAGRLKLRDPADTRLYDAVKRARLTIDERP